MAYEIPQQLKHKEKIIFGLTFEQLGWLFLFSIPIILIFKIETISWELRTALAMIPSTLAIGFMFFNLLDWIKEIILFFQFRIAILGSKEMARLINIKKVKNNTIYSTNEVAILEIVPINFSIKTESEKESIITGFQKFLNSVDFPIQFVITTHKLDITSYLKDLRKKSKNEKLYIDFANFINNLISETQMRNRKFFLVITKKSDLDIQSQVCIERFRQIGLKARRLRTKELLSNLKLFFNDIGDKRTAKDGGENSLHYIIGPNRVRDLVDSFRVNKKYCRIITTSGYPRNVEMGFLDKIISTNDDFDISLHIEPFSLDSTMVMLNKELQKQRADLYAESIKNSINPSLEIKFNDTRKVLEDLQKGNNKLFNISLYINCKSDTPESLNYLTKKVEAELNSIMIQPKIPYFRQIKGYKSSIPAANDELKENRNVTTSALSAFFPFTSPFLTLEKNGIMLGLNKNKVPFIRDIFNLSNANGVVLATSGSGKSYFTKLLILRQILSGTKVIIIDPQGEYVNLTNHSKGELITISKTSETIINPLDLMGHDFIEKRLTLIDLFRVMFGELSEIQKAILDKAITETYAKKGITEKSYKGKKMPILGDLYKELERLSKSSGKAEKVTYQALLNRLYMYTNGTFSFMNRQTSIKFDSDFVCFNIGDMPKQVKPVVMFLILDYVYTKMKESIERKLLVVDEAWSLLSKTEEASYIFEIVKTCRKFNLGLLLITQDVEDLVSSRAGTAVLSNSAYSLLLRQKPSVIDNVVKMFNLSKFERDYLLTANQGKGILIMDNEHQELQVIASPEENRIITTNPDEINGNSVEKQEYLKDVNINLDLNRGLFYGKFLSDEEKNYLANHGYGAGQFVPIGKPRQEECWVKSNGVESLEHSFMVQNIRQELLKIGGKVQIYVVQKPDIIYTNKIGEEIAIEVETGKNFNKHRNRLIEKFDSLKANYRGKVIVVLTNSDYKDRYRSILGRKFPLFLRKDLKKLFDSQRLIRRR